VPTFVDRGVSRGQRGGSPTVVYLSFLDRRSYFLSSSSSFILTRAEWTLFQTHCYSENLVAPGIEPGTSEIAARRRPIGLQNDKTYFVRYIYSLVLQFSK
jgi:hypothetical protein